MRKLAFVLVLLILFCGCGAEPVFEEDVGYDFPWSDISRLRPAIMVGGELYYYDDYFLLKFIPESYTTVGKFTPVPDELPTEELQMRCNSEFSGTVYAGNETNSTVYISFDGDEKYCIRFAHEKMIDSSVGHNGIIRYGEKLFLHPGSVSDNNLHDELPEGYALAGTLKYIGIDYFPQNDFETNLKSYWGGGDTDGKEIYANTNNTDVIYIQYIDYHRDEFTIKYLRCPSFEE
ncbi:MAG: hypothetical protein IKJ57_06200 [Oscillospiraceae bacterium]|nr:hypothetical protein [Oscillospiraceae bacterium]